MIKDFEPRLYQQTILATATKKNTLVVLPTGMGKTNVFLMLAAHRLKQFPNSKILFIGPTKPLIDQYMEVFKKHFEIEESKMAIFTGLVKPKRREELWKTSQIIFSTPQGLENDIIQGRIKLEEVSLLGVDEAHRAVGDYAYVFVAKQYRKRARLGRIIALTASPGSDMEKITEVCNNLFIESVEVRTDEDPDVKPYVKGIDITWVKVELPKVFEEVQKYIKEFLKERLTRLKQWGILHRADVNFVNKTDLLKLQAQLRGKAASGDKDYTIWNAISVLAEIMKMQHALELIETQGVIPLYNYLDKLDKDAYTSKVKAVKNIVRDLNFRSALIRSRLLYEQKVEHPKLIELQKIVSKELKSSTKIIIFNQYRDNALDIQNKLNTLEGVRASIFVGQKKLGGTGYTQKQQKEILEKFREGEFNVLVATSIGEEGLDIPKVDIVIFYEPIPSAIRSIQRRGRTGRQDKGRVIMLMAKDTRDEGYRWSAHHKEKRMYSNLYKLRNLQLSVDYGHQKLNEYVMEEDKNKAFVDYREKNSSVVKELIDAGIAVKLEQLNNADYLLSSRVAVEFKTVQDFADSIVDGRLLLQIKALKQNYEKPLLVIQGQEDIYSARNIHPNAVRGMLATITISYGIPIIYTKNPKETASLFVVIAKREQENFGKAFSPHAGKRVMSEKEQQEYIVSAFPGVGSTLAKPLLKHFGSIKNIINATKEELEKVEKIGPKKAAAILDILDKRYES